MINVNHSDHVSRFVPVRVLCPIITHFKSRYGPTVDIWRKQHFAVPISRSLNLRDGIADFSAARHDHSHA